MRVPLNNEAERIHELHTAALKRIQELALKVTESRHQRDDLLYAAEKGRAYYRAVVKTHGVGCTCSECGFLRALFVAVDACADKLEKPL